MKAKYRLKVAAVRRQCQVVVKRGVALWYVEYNIKILGLK